MSDKLVDRTDRAFEYLAAWAVRHRLLVALFSLVLLAGGLYFASRVVSDNSLDAYFDRSDPSYVAYMDYLEEFLSDEVAYVLYRVPDSPHGPFDLEAMAKIQALTERLEAEVPFVREVTSLANTEFIRADEDMIEVGKLLRATVQSQQELLALRELVMERPLYVDFLIDKTAQYGAIILEMDRSSVDPVEEIIFDPARGTALDNLYPQVSDKVIRRILASPEYAGIEFFQTGDVAMNAAYNNVFMQDSSVGIPLTFLLLALLSLLLFRASLLGLLGPLTVVVLSVVLVAGFMGLFGWVLGMFFGIVPTLISGVGVAQSVHIILEYQRRLARGQNRAEAVQGAIGKVGGACLMAAVTTALGFLVMSVSELKALSEMAMYAAIGVMCTFILSTTLLVAFLGSGTAKQPVSKTSVQPFVLNIVDGCAALCVRHPRALVASGAAILALSLAGITMLKVDFNFLDEFKPRVEWRQHTELVEQVMGGVLSVVYIFDTGRSDGIKNPQFLQALEGLQEFAEAQAFVKNSFSVADLQKDINRSFHADDPAFFRLADDARLISQYFLVYELSGGKAVYDYVSRDYAKAVVELRVGMTNSRNLKKLLADIDAYLARHPVPDAELRKTGVGLMWVKMAEYISHTQLVGYSLVFLGVAAILCIAFGSLKVGLLSMIPNLAPVIVVLGAMGWLGLHLDYVKLLLATVAIGIAVDDTIHLMINLRRQFLKTGNYQQAVLLALQDVGPALLITTIILVGAFSCYLLSSMAIISSFGVLLSAAIVVALVADLLFMPALVLLTRPFGPERAQSPLAENTGSSEQAASRLMSKGSEAATEGR